MEEVMEQYKDAIVQIIGVISIIALFTILMITFRSYILNLFVTVFYR